MQMFPDESYKVVEHATRRLIVEAPLGFDVSEKRIEECVPAATALDLSAGCTSWDDVVERVKDTSPIGMLRYRKIERHPVMKLAGHQLRATSYALGNFLVAEQMYGVDPSIFQYLPFEVILWEDPDGRTYFSFQQPSSVLANFDDEKFGSYGREFDGKIARVLRAMGCTVPRILEESAG